MVVAWKEAVRSSLQPEKSPRPGVARSAGLFLRSASRQHHRTVTLRSCSAALTLRHPRVFHTKKAPAGSSGLEFHGIEVVQSVALPSLLRTVHRQEYDMFCPPHRVPPERITWADPELWNGVPSAHQSVLPCGSSATSKQKNENAHSLTFATQPGLATLTSSLRTRSIGGKAPDDIPGWGLTLFAAFSSCIQV